MDPSPPRLRRASALAAWAAALGLLSAVPFAGPARAAAPSDSLTVTITPRDVWPPAPVANLQAAPGAEGQMLLSWIAPDSNGNVFATSSPAAGYTIRVATFSVASVGGSTTAWWSGATDVQSLPPPAIPAAPPTPAFPGTTQYLLLNQLWPGVTYYAMMISSDAAGNWSGADLNSIPPAVQASTLVYDAAPPAPTGFAAAASTSSLTASWNAVAAYDLDFYRLYLDSTPPYDFSHQVSTTVFAPATSATLTGLSTGTYALRVTAVDRGQPRWPGAALESAFSSSATVRLTFAARPPQAPYGVALTSTPISVSLSWLPSVRYADLTPFAVSTAPTPAELSGYSVFRATSPILGAWKDAADLSTATLSWTDLAGGPQYYYFVQANNSSAVSARSIIRTAATRSALAVAPDDQSYFEIFAPQIGPLEGVAGDPASAYLIQVSSRSQDLGGVGGRVMKSLEFDAWQGGLLLTPTFRIPGQGLLKMHYDLSSSTAVAPSAWRTSAAAPTPQNMSAYWYNGRSWVQLYGTLDSVSQTLSVQTPFFGRYELRTVERTGGFSFNLAGVSNRFLTPNGDRKNDNVVFTFDNPKDSAVVGRIFDLHGRLIVAGLPPGPVGSSLVWDGTAGGRPVPGGVYVYEISAEGVTYSGTIVVIR